MRHETLKTTHAELEENYHKLKQQHTDSARQLEKWNTLDGRDKADLDKLREEKIKLDITVQDLENQLADAKKKADESSVLRTKNEKWKKSVEDFKVRNVISSPEELLHHDITGSTR